MSPSDETQVESNSTTVADSVDSTKKVPAPRRKAGRPKKKELAARKTGKRGRPKGTAAIINDYRDRMLASPKSKRVLDAIFAAALDDEHKGQQAAWKLIIDRVAPLSAFEQEITKSGGRPNISINISGIGGDVSVGATEGDDEDNDGAIEAEFTPVDE